MSLFFNFFKGHQRSVKAKKNIVALFFLKGLSVIISFLFVPLALDYLQPEKYGIWLTVSSVLAWVNMFDFGLGNGLRNKLVEAITQKKYETAKLYVSTTYAVVTAIATVLFLIGVLTIKIIPLHKVFNTSLQYESLLQELVILVLGVFCLQFIVKLINSVFLALQQPAYSNLLNTVSSLLALLVIFILNQLSKGNLLWFGASVAFVNLLVPLLASLFLYKTKLKPYAPSISYIDVSGMKELMTLSLKFFVMQGAALIVYATDNLIISNISGPAEVTVYQIAFKYFNIVLVFYTILTTPLWSAFTEAYIEKDWKWIKRIFKKYLSFWGLTLTGIVLMVFMASYFYRIWVGSTIKVPFLLNVIIALWVVLSTFIMIFSNFLSGINKVKLSTYQSIVVAIINIPLSFYFGRNLGMGSAGVILATVVCILLRVAFQPIQVYKILKGTAQGIWNQ